MVGAGEYGWRTSVRWCSGPIADSRRSLVGRRRLQRDASTPLATGASRLRSWPAVGAPADRQVGGPSIRGRDPASCTAMVRQELANTTAAKRECGAAASSSRSDAIGCIIDGERERWKTAKAR